VFGCEPCPEQKHLVVDFQTFLKDIGPILSPSFIESNVNPSSGESPGYVAEDNETAAVDKVATAHHVPFIGFRAVSDGGGDPLHLPGYPSEFFVYRQLAADNAARTTLAFLKTWHDPRPTHGMMTVRRPGRSGRSQAASTSASGTGSAVIASRPTRISSIRLGNSAR
jgi:hypothetical protein